MLIVPAKVTVRVRRLVALTAIAAFTVTLAPSQTFFGSVVGTVTDTSGASIPGSKVTLTQYRHQRDQID